MNTNLTPNNAVDYSNPAGFDCGTSVQQDAFLTYHEISVDQFDAVVKWFNGDNAIPAAFVKSSAEISALITGADCKATVVTLLGDITLLGHSDLELVLMTYADFNRNASGMVIGAFGIDLFTGLIEKKGADEFHFCKASYTYSNNQGVKRSGIVFVATAGGAPVYYAEYTPNPSIS